MLWEEIRQHFPNQWLLLEALEAHSEENKRIIERLAVINTFADSPSALRAYAEFHRKASERELYVFHTSRAALDVTERRWLGIRGIRSPL